MERRLADLEQRLKDLEGALRLRRGQAQAPDPAPGESRPSPDVLRLRPGLGRP